MLTGIGVSSGIGIAKAMLWKPKISFDYVPRKTDDPEYEISRYYTAQNALVDKINKSRVKTALRYGEKETGIFDAYLMMLYDDVSLTEPLKEMIQKQAITAEYAVMAQFTEQARQLKNLDDEYMSQRSDDILSLRDQMLSLLIGMEAVDISHLDYPTIIVTHSLSPSDMVDMDYSRLEGIICESGGYSSHTAIIARTLSIPAVFAATGITHSVKSGDFIALDGGTGEIWLDPKGDNVKVLCRRRVFYAEENEKLQYLHSVPTITTDQHRIELAANIGTYDEVEATLDASAEAIGLFRTERLLTGNIPADEETQFRIYRNVIEKMNGKAVCFRTFDDGCPLMPLMRAKNEENPSLGYRGVRVSLGRPSVFRAQLRALLRASAYGSLKIMFPMVSTVDEQLEALTALNNIKAELAREGILFDEKLPVGVLIETPSAALMAEALAKHADFFTIGVNDLVQFILAVDRTNPTLGYLYHYYHPSVLRAMDYVIRTAHADGITCNICGELPYQTEAMPLLLGLGPDGFSLNTNFILPSRKILNTCSLADCRELAKKAMVMDTAMEVQRLVQNQ